MGRRPVHGNSYPPSVEYRTWSRMKSRCNNPRDASYASHGGRGIRVCDEWQADFGAFYAYMGPRPQDKASLDRIDNNGNYEPGNVRWATWVEQNNNRRPFDPGTGRKPVIRSDGVVYPSLRAAAKSVGLSDGAVRKVVSGVNKTAGGFTWRFHNE